MFDQFREALAPLRLGEGHAGEFGECLGDGGKVSIIAGLGILRHEFGQLRDVLAACDRQGPGRRLRPGRQQRLLWQPHGEADAAQGQNRQGGDEGGHHGCNLPHVNPAGHPGCILHLQAGNASGRPVRRQQLDGRAQPFTEPEAAVEPAGHGQVGGQAEKDIIVPATTTAENAKTTGRISPGAAPAYAVAAAMITARLAAISTRCPRMRLRTCSMGALTNCATPCIFRDLPVPLSVLRGTLSVAGRGVNIDIDNKGY
ncbi:MAG: hypothetical protein IPK28_02065 [Devosia sp.]|nr:hypothetical protein [Devosia sp.]